jgi:hypothetical protein
MDETLRTRHPIIDRRESMEIREGEPDSQPAASRRKWWMFLATLVALAAVGWGAWRRWEDGRWNSQAIAARFTEVTVQRLNEKDVHLLLRYSLTNSTRADYRLASPPLGVLMERAADGGLEEIDSVLWEPIAVPAGKTVNAEFDLTVHSVEDLTTPEAIHSEQDLKAFANRELSRLQGLVFFDYGKRYWIDLPKGWP